MATTTEAARRKRTASKTGKRQPDVTDSAALRYALQFAVRGIPVFPCNVFKEPILRGDWRVNATTDADMITAWSRRSACTAFGMPTGQQSGRAVADIDPRHGGSREGHGLTTTEMVKTPSDGWHCHYSCNGAVKSNPKFAPGVEIKGDGNYVILPGGRCHSKNADGSLGPVGTYRRTGRASPIAVLPPHLAVRADRKPTEPRSGAPGAISEGDRHDALVRRAAKWAAMGVVGRDLDLLLLDFNDRECRPSKDPQEVRRIAAWASEQVGGADHDAEVRKRVESLLIDKEARDEVAAKLAVVNYIVPTTSLAEDLAKPRVALPYTVEELHVKGGNTLLVAGYKTGKTVVAKELTRALADRDAFLGRYPVHFERHVGYLQFEMTEEQSEDWDRDMEIQHPERVHVWHLRGQSLPFWIESVKEDVVGWCLANDIGWLTVDTSSRAWKGLVDAEGNNIKIMEFYLHLDEIKRRGGVDDLLASIHTPRAEMGEGEERARAGGASEDWMDHGWYLTKDRSETRSLRARGRGVDVPARDLTFDPATRRYTDSGRRRVDRKDREQMESVVDAIGVLMDRGGDDYPAATKAITDLMKGVAGDKRNAVLREAIPKYVHREGNRSSGYLHTLTEQGLELRQRRVKLSDK